jgi:multiple sugar transport system substrate-binding protein
MGFRGKAYIGCSLLVALVLLLAGCSRAGPGDDRLVVRFVFWGNFRDFALWKKVSEAFEENNPDLRIRLEYVTGQYHQKLPLQLISNTAADIILMDDEIYPSYAVRGHLEDLKPYIERDRAVLHLDKFLPTSLESFTYGGLQCALPWDGNVVVIFLNKELFREAGVPLPDDDWTYDDLRRISKRLTRDRDGDGRLDVFGSNLNHGLMALEPVLWSFGGDVLTPDRTRFALDTPEALAALRYIYDLKFVDHTSAQPGEVADMGDELQFLTGRTAIMQSTGYITQVLDAAEDAVDWEMVVPPAGPGGRYTRVTWDGISLNARTSREKKEAGWRFIRFLLSEPTQAMVAESGRGIPVREDFAWKYLVRADTEAREEVQLLATGYGRLTPITPKFLEIFNATNPDLLGLSSGTKTPEQAVASMKPKVNKALRDELERWGPPPERP